MENNPESKTSNDGRCGCSYSRQCLQNYSKVEKILSSECYCEEFKKIVQKAAEEPKIEICTKPIQRRKQPKDKNKEERLNKVVMTSRHHKAKKIQLQKGKEHYQELLERLSKMSKELDKQLI